MLLIVVLVQELLQNTGIRSAVYCLIADHSQNCPCDFLNIHSLLSGVPAENMVGKTMPQLELPKNLIPRRVKVNRIAHRVRAIAT